MIMMDLKVITKSNLDCKKNQSIFLGEIMYDCYLDQQTETHIFDVIQANDGLRKKNPMNGKVEGSRR